MNKFVAPNVAKGDFTVLNKSVHDRIMVGERKRPLDNAKVTELVESIKENGVLNPILVRKDGDGVIHLIAGLHRFEAIKQIWKQEENASSYTLPVRYLIVNDDGAAAVEIVENLHRNNLTKEEIKKFAHEYGLLLADGSVSANGTGGTGGTGGEDGTGGRPQGGGTKKSWFTLWHEGANIPKKTANNWWTQYKKANGLTTSPSKANKEQQLAFHQWHLEQQREKQRKDAERKKTEAKDAAKKDQEELEAAWAVDLSMFADTLEKHAKNLGNKPYFEAFDMLEKIIEELQ